MRRVIKPILLLLIIFSTIYLNSCSDDSVVNPPPTPVVLDLMPLDTGYAIGARTQIFLYADDTLHEGYNKIYVILKDSLTGGTVSDAHITFKLTDHNVGTPVENPPENAVNGIFTGAWILNQSQASESPLHWFDSVFVHNHVSDLEGAASFGGFRVLENPEGFKSITMPDSSKLYLSYIKPDPAVTGINVFEFLINRNEAGYAPDGSYTVEVTPVYIADGHTTANNVNPAGTSNGHYFGAVNFDRSGAWRIELHVMKNTMHYDTSFEVTY